MCLQLEDKEVSIDMRALNIERDRAAALAKAAARKQRKESDQQQARPSSGGARFRPPMGGFGMPMMGFPGSGGGGGAPDLDKMMGTLSGIFEQMQQHYSDSSKKDGESTANQAQKRERKQTYTVRDVRPLLEEMEEMRKIDFDSVRDAALRRAENHGIVFLDEIDKLANSTEYQSGKGRGIKGEGVQKELLAITDGATVQTSHGPVSTNHILFIGAGAFHVAKPSDLLPELQGRFPVRVELKALTQADLRRILTEPDFNLLQQQSALLATEGVRVDFTDDGIDEIAKVAHEVNSTQQNIGARRLRTIVARVMEDISFRAPTIKRDAPPERVDATYVRQRVGSLSSKTDLSRFIL
jgi:ATP-dependent HslUV protease ATP-binding subunit HslU